MSRNKTELATTHELYEAMASHARKLKKVLTDVPLDGNTVFQGQIDLLWFFYDLFKATYEHSTAHNFADFLYAVGLTIGKQGESLELTEGFDA